MTTNRDPGLTLISHRLCPYVQRAVIALTEKNVGFDRVHVDLANKPEWFLAASPLGKTPVLRVGEEHLFESNAILEYLEETQSPRLHPRDPLRRAEHRSWIEFGSAILNDIAGFYGAADEPTFNAKHAALLAKLDRIEARIVGAPWFDGENFTLVDAVFGPVFRYFDAFDRIAGLDMLRDSPKIQRWRANLAARPSIQAAVSPDYDTDLWRFLLNRKSHLTRLMVKDGARLDGV